MGKLWPVIVFIYLWLISSVSSEIVHSINVSELFTMKIEPRSFNWTQHSYSDSYTFRPSIKGYPDLPSWMRYIYSEEYLAGYLYGTPGKNLAGTELYIEIVGLHRETYETKRIVVRLLIMPKRPASNLVQMKIDNLNWVHLMDPGRMENLKNLFRYDLWPESSGDLHVVFMESAVKMGARLPLKPQQTEGVFVHLGSEFPLSKRLQDLQNEVKPLYKISTCNFKKTSVQRIFQNAGFILDWCAFKTVGDEGEMSHQSSETAHDSELSILKRLDRWESISLGDAPERNYIDELAFAIAIPAMILALLITILTTILCFQHEIMQDDYSENYFLDLFSIFKPTTSEPTVAPIVQMVQFSDTTNQPTTTLKSLKDTPNYLIDNLSLRSQSPTSAIYPETTAKSNTYLRPKPPPYHRSPSASLTFNRNGVDI